MTDALAPLSERELTALLVFVEGGNVAAIGPWKEVIEGLAARGFLVHVVDWNYVITEAGRAAAVAAEDDNIGRFLKHYAIASRPQSAGTAGELPPLRPVLNEAGMKAAQRRLRMDSQCGLSCAPGLDCACYLKALSVVEAYVGGCDG